MSENNKKDSSYDLLIVESPAKAKTIQKYLDGMNIKVVASVGHIKELPKKKLGVDLNNFEIELVTISGKEDKIKDIKKLAKDARNIYLGSDPDREGEAIAVHLREEIKLKKNVYRVLFNEVTKDAIKKSLANPQQIDDKKYEAQKTRRILDRLVGYKISPLLWRKLGGGLSAGRVQSVALRLIVEREDEITSFVPEKWFQIVAKLKKDNITFESKYHGEKIDKKTDLRDEVLAKQILADVQNYDFVVKDVERKEKKQNPSAPFTTSRLQQEAANKLKFSSKKTMEIAQRLYDGSISLGEKGHQGLITYMRTDSVRTEPKALENVREYISDKFGKDYLPDSPNTFKSKNQAAAQDAHEAIRPTNLENDPESIKAYLSDDEYDLYKLIWNKFIASQMNPAIIDQTVVMFDVNNHFFKSVGSVIRFDGFRAVYLDEDEKKKDDDDDGALPKLDLEESLKPIDVPKLLEKWTTPPPRYTEATLIKELEHRGIGRPSTYAAIISNITDRSYVKKEDAKFHPTETGTKLCRFLIEHFPRELDISFTAKMESQLDDIEEGNAAWTKILKDFWDGLSSTLKTKEKELESISKPSGTKQVDPKSLTGIRCKKCDKGEYIVIKGKNGEFLSCSEYPSCTSTQNLKRDKKGNVSIDEPKFTYAANPCPDCGKKMILRNGQYGKYYSCEGYPECRKTMPVTTGITCPDCGKGEFTMKKSKAGNTFYSCTKFPNCKNALSEKPVNEPCPKCKYPVTGAKKVKGKIELHCGKCKKTTTLE